MAVPERRSQSGPQPHIDDLGDQKVVERVAGGGWRWWWMWLVIAAVAVWWAGWGWDGTGGWWWGRQAHTAVITPAPGARTTETLTNAGAQEPAPYAVGANQQPMSGPGVQVLKAQDKQAFIGKQFAASDVPVQEKVTGHAMWIGEKHPMLAVVTGKSSGAEHGVSVGQIVDAVGTVEKAPPEAQAKREWDLSSQDASRLEKEGAYIQVSQLTVPQQ